MKVGRFMREIVRNSSIMVGIYVLIVAVIGYMSSTNPLITALLLGTVSVVVLCLCKPKWGIMGVVLGLFINFPLPISSQLVNTDQKIILLLIIGLSVVMIPIMWKRTAMIRGWWGLAALSVFSLLLTSIAVNYQNGSSFVTSHFYGAESIVVFFLFSLFTYSNIKDKKDLDTILNILPIVLLIGLVLRLVSTSSTIFAMGVLDKNTFGFLLDLIIPLTWIAINNRKGKWWFILLLVSLFLLAINNSRGAIIGIGFSLVYFLIFFKSHSKRTILFYLSLVLVMICAIPFIPSEIIQRIMSSGDLQDYTQMSRLQLWSTSFEVTKMYPIFGTGFYNFYYYFQNYYAANVKFLHPHNAYLNVLVSTGIVGFISFLLTARYLLSWVKIELKKGSQEIRWYFVGFMLGIIALSVHGVFDSVLLTPQTLLLLGSLCGIAFKATLIYKESSEAEGYLHD